MKQFFEQYGGVALGILALLVLIAMITPVGNIIKTSLQGTTKKFSTSINSQTDNMTNQMSDIMNSAGEFLNVKEDGKMYKGDVLYTGWNGDKAYLDGVENPVENNYVACLVWFYNDVSLNTKEIWKSSDLDYDAFNIISFKIDDVILFENAKSKTLTNITASMGVSTFETIVVTPSNYSVSVRDQLHIRNYKVEVLSDNGTNKITKFSGTILEAPYMDIKIDDLNITKDY